MNRMVYSLLALLLGLAAWAGCAPAAPTPSAPAPAAPAAAPQAAPQLTPEDPAWAKIGEAAKKEGTLTAYDYDLVGDVGTAVKGAFESRFRINLDIITGRGAEFLERVKTERRVGQMTGDYVSSSTAHVMNFKVAGLTESVFDKLPELADKTKFVLDIRQFDPEGHILGFNYLIYDGYINTKLVKPEEAPKSLKDFLDPKWRGKIVSRDPVVSSGEYIYWVPLLNRGIIDRAYLQALGDQKLLFHVSARGSAEMLARGEAPLHTPGSNISFAHLALEGAPIKAVPLEHGTMVTLNPLAAIKGGPHPNATLVYLNWRFSHEGQTVYMKATGQNSVRKDVQEFRHPNVISGAKIAFVVTQQDMLDAGRLFLEKMLVPLFKR